MNWLSDFIFGVPSAFETQELGRAFLPPVEEGECSGRRGDADEMARRTGNKFRQFSAGVRKRLKKSLGKIPKPMRWLVVGGMAATLFFVPLFLLYSNATAKKYLPALPSLPSLFPSTSAPVIPAFDPEVLTTDAAAAPRRWKYIVIHHSASTRGSAQIFDQAHRDRGWRGLGYHFVIGNGTDQGDGVIAPGPRWYSQEAGAHAHSTEHNEYGIGICLVGNFDLQKPSAAQWAALVDLTKRLCARHGIQPGNIVGHNLIRQGGSTACPGKNFPLQELRDAVFSGGR